MKTSNTKPIGQLPDFVTPEDLLEAEKIEKELDRFDRHLKPFSRQPAFLAHDDAMRAYSQDPSDENASALERTSAQAFLVSSESYSRARVTVRSAFRDLFVKGRFASWASSIVERGLAQARQVEADLEAEEAQRYKELTGEELGMPELDERIQDARDRAGKAGLERKHALAKRKDALAEQLVMDKRIALESPLLKKARLPVAELERLLAAVGTSSEVVSYTQNIRTFIEILRQCAKQTRRKAQAG